MRQFRIISSPKKPFLLKSGFIFFNKAVCSLAQTLYL